MAYHRDPCINNMENKPNILITGATGLLGKGIEETMSCKYNVIGIHKRDYLVENSKILHHTLDIHDLDGLAQLMKKYKFSTIVHAADIANVDYAETHYSESRASNISGVLNMIDVCRDNMCKLIYISTNAVFNGFVAPYSEDDIVAPINKYGQIKVECEKIIRESFKDYTIVRPILMYGWNYSINRQNPVTMVYSKLIKNETLHMVNDVYENPLFNIQCGRAIWTIIEKNISGIVHLAGGERLNRYEFAVAVARVFDMDINLIKEVDSSYFPSIAPRPRDTSFNTKRMETEIGIKALTISEGLMAMKNSMKL